MFNMDFKSDGISWVGNIYQKFEAICQEVDGIMIQEKAKYIESQMQTGCDNVRKFCAEVMQDLLLPAAACDVKGPVSDLSLVYDVDVGMCKKSKVGSPIEEKTSTPAELDVFVSSGKGSSPPLLAGHYNLNEGEDRGAPTKESIRISEPVTRCDCLEKAGEYNNYHSDACVAVSSALPPNSSPSTDSVGSCNSHEPTLLASVVSLDKGHDLQNESDVLDFVLPSSEIGRSNDFDWEEASMSTDAVEPEAAEEFEDVKFEENCLDPEVEKNEICFISVPERKKASYRKKLRDVFASRIRSAKKHGHEQLETHSLDGNAETKCCKEFSVSTHGGGSTKKLLAHDTCESEWELL
eukprot:TRINITY_DN102966_c0_g1_i1.p1 TRINITY_DN102966_c0_g1~~TRINITY_DN102966_c0_g1_i1.p1  ORF type:complete len:351 (+),score=80.36 TRINITY_DN102966_c0_g1_i1:395-1447(+)